MKMKQITAAAFSLLLFFAAGCAAETPFKKEEDSKPTSTVESVPPEPVIIYNPLTGCSGLDESKADTRPVAIMINNINVAQGVQCGLDAADIIYETEVEGGITRLLAVYQDVSKVGQIGTVRSARYPYIDLALGHNAIYIHCGQDPNYAKPHLKDIDDIDLSADNYGQRIKNGLASEHTLYTFGDKLWNGLSSKFKTQNGRAGGTWQNFAAEDETVTLMGGTADSVTVPFSKSYHSTFRYDAATGLYTRLSGNKELKDYKTAKATTVKNVFVLMTRITTYPDGKHRKVDLNSGDGYYFTNGTYTPILWSKGNATNPLVFTNTDGTPLTVSAGDSWVCLPDKTTSMPIY